jgi:hypothetical protein
LTIIGASSQSTDLLRLRDSTPTTLLSVSQIGTLTTSGNINTTGQARVGTATSLGQLSVVNASSGNIGAVIRGAASQSANLQEWQSSAPALLSRVASDGSMFAPSFTTTNGRVAVGENTNGGTLRLERATGAQTNPGANLARIYFRDGTTAGTLKLVVRAGAAGAETTILDNIPT